MRNKIEFTFLYPMEPRACLNIVNGQSHIAYFSHEQLVGHDLLESRECLIMDVNMGLGGHYMIYTYNFGAAEVYTRYTNVVSKKSLVYHTGNLYYVDDYRVPPRCVVAKYLDSNFTQHIDLDIRDPLLSMIKHNFGGELREQIKMLNAEI